MVAFLYTEIAATIFLVILMDSANTPRFSPILLIFFINTDLEALVYFILFHNATLKLS